MTLIKYFYLFSAALFVSFLTVPPLSNLAVRIGGVDTPDERKVHTSETPRLGGVAIFCAFLFSTVFLIDIDVPTKGFLCGAIIIFLTGLADDLASLTPKQKFMGETVAATVAVLVGNIYLTSIGSPTGGSIDLGPAAIPFTIFAVVGVTNAVNLIDGLDGLAAGITVIACVAFGVLAFQSGNWVLLELIVALLGAVVGFLRYNTYPATIFMGDSGSLLLGYCSGLFSIMLVTRPEARLSAFTPLIVLAVPIVDTLVVMSNRLRRGKGIFSPDRTHIHHRLLDVGIGHKYTVILVYGITYLLCAFAIIFRQSSDGFLAVSLLVGGCLFYSLVHLLGKGALESRFRDLRSDQPIVETSTYRNLVELSHRLLWLIKYLLLLILSLAIFIPLGYNQGYAAAASLLLLLFTVLLMQDSDRSDLFCQFVLYFTSAYIIFLMENTGRDTELLGVPLLTISNILFSVLLLAEGIKIVLRKRTSQLLSTPFEYLVLFIVIAAPLLPKEAAINFHLLTVAAKSVVLFVAYQLILVRKTRKNRKVIFATYVALIAFVGKLFI